MTDEEFQRLKEEEKEHLRAKKRLRSTLEALKRRNRVQSVVRQMKRGAGRLLDETESLVEALRRTVAQQSARLDVALDDETSLEDAEEEEREERAESLVRQYKAAQSASSRRSKTDETGDGPAREGPEKTIGRMRIPRSEDGSE